MMQVDLSDMNEKVKPFDAKALKRIDDYLKRFGVVDIKNSTNAVIQRKNGKEFTFEEHLRGLVYSLLTNQRKWSDVEPKLPQIDRLFFNFDIDEIKKKDGAYFERGIRELRCGNISIKSQMASLHDNIRTMERIASDYNSLDIFVTSLSPEEIVSKLSSSGSIYKIKGLGVALAYEYLRNVGIDESKPDTHLRRFFGSSRMGFSSTEDASEQEVLNVVNSLASGGEYTKFEIDYLIWAYCADGYGEVCTATPNCSKCVIRDCCKNETHL